MIAALLRELVRLEEHRDVLALAGVVTQQEAGVVRVAGELATSDIDGADGKRAEVLGSLDLTAVLVDDLVPQPRVIAAPKCAPSAIFALSRRPAAGRLNSGVRPLKDAMANPYLVSGAVLSAVAALLHLGCIFFGPSWYRFFGAGERMAQLSAAGSLVPTLITAGIATVLALWSLYALSGAGVILRLPLVRLALCAIAGIYLLRGLAGLGLAVLAPGDRGLAFWWWSSVICLGVGALYLVGTRQVWSQLSRGAA
jgi:hypothetical protein